MKEERINNLIDKFLKGEISEKDFQVLHDEMDVLGNEDIINEIIEIDACVQADNNSVPNIAESYNKVAKKLGFDKKGRIIPFKIFKYAASIILLVGVAYFCQMFFSTDLNSIPKINEDSITLQLENGNIEVITASGEKKVVNKKGEIVGTQTGDKLTYQIDKDLKKLTYNTLKVPNGKTFELELTDGTHIHLNAGSSLKYPVNFIKGEERRVFLVGEAYFDVAKDANQPFIVSTEKLNIRVLGTEFNVSSYKGSKDINTVLVEGSVAIYKEDDVYNNKTSTHLTPGHIATWSNVKKNISIDKVDTREYTAWIDGKLIFKRRTFGEILIVLERHFDIEIENTYEALNSERFLASFDTESIEQILEYFRKTNEFSYEINNNKIIIKQP